MTTTTATTTNLCDTFTRAHKGKGKPPRDAKCGMCNVTYEKHAPVGKPQERIAYLAAPDVCKHFTKLDGKRGKPAPASACAVCGVVWTGHAPKGAPKPVKHPDRVRPTEMVIRPIKPTEEGTKTAPLTKAGIDTPSTLPAVIEAKIIEPTPPPAPPVPATQEAAQEAAQETETIEETIEEESEGTIEGSADDGEQDADETPWPVSNPPWPENKPQVKGSNGDGEQDGSGEPSDRIMEMLEREEEEKIQSYISQGMTRDEAEMKVLEDYDW